MLACHRSLIFGSQKYFHFAVEGSGDAAQFRECELLFSGDLAVVGSAAKPRFRVELFGGHSPLFPILIYLLAQWGGFFARGHISNPTVLMCETRRC